MTSEFDIAEIGALRSEINSVISRMNGNENFSAGIVSAIIGFVAVNDYTWLSFVLMVLAVLAAASGARRNWEMQQHLAKIDMYLRKAEASLKVGGGWTEHYYSSIEGSKTGGYSVTRIIFWATLILISLCGSLYVLYSLGCN